MFFEELKAGKWRARVCPEIGMNLIDLEHDGKKLLRTPEDEEQLRGTLHLYGTPLLFPANRTENGRFLFQGKEYALPLSEPARGNNLHGEMADAPFVLTERTESRISAVYRNTGGRYPFAFDMTITDELDESGWTRTARILAKEDMPFTIAFHTTFVEPETFSVPVGRRFLCNERYIPTGEMTPPEPFGRAISGFYEAAGHRAAVDGYVFETSPNFDEWVLFNAGGTKGFLCIEPQCGEVNGLNTQGHHVLRAGESEEFRLRITR